MLPLVPAWPLPVFIFRKILPAPAFSVVPVAMLIVATPASRLPPVTPFAVVSLAISVMSPLVVVILALTKIELPACAVSEVPGLVMPIASVNVMLLSACRSTGVISPLILTGSMVELPAGLSPNR